MKDQIQIHNIYHLSSDIEFELFNSSMEYKRNMLLKLLPMPILKKIHTISFFLL